MNNIQVTTINNESIEAISGRIIKEQLEVKGDYTTWIKRQISSLELREKEDYVTTFTDEGRHKNIISHFFSLDIAKHICLVSKTQKGRSFRQKLIDHEKKAKVSIQQLTDQNQKLKETVMLQNVTIAAIPDSDAERPQLLRILEKSTVPLAVDYAVIELNATKPVKIHAWSARYLRNDGFTSYPLHMALVEMGLVKRDGKRYLVTEKGKTYGGEDQELYKADGSIENIVCIFPTGLWESLKPKSLNQLQRLENNKVVRIK